MLEQTCQAKTKNSTPPWWVLTWYTDGNNCKVKFATKQAAVAYMTAHSIEGSIEPSSNQWYLSGIADRSMPIAA